MRKIEMKKDIDSLRRRFSVEDLVPEGSKFVFLLESGHTSELKYGFPVSGSSGVTMLKVLTDTEYPLPLGRLIGNPDSIHEEDAFLLRLGLMNVSLIPMQAAAYPTEEASNFVDLMTSMQGVRSNNTSSKYKKDDWNILQEILVEGLRERLIENQDKMFIPCGKFAQKFLRLAGEGLDLKIIWGIPHPSYNSWERESYSQVVNEMKELVRAKEKST